MSDRRRLITRRGLVAGLTLGAGGLLSGCDRLNDSAGWRDTLRLAEKANRTAQRALLDRTTLAREYRPQDISHQFPENGTRRPAGADYDAMARDGFTDWTVRIDGLVDRPQTLSIGAIRAMPSRTQITRHDCVEGWSAIGQWTGVPLAALLDRAGLKPEARYLVFHCADRRSNVPYYESIDQFDAYHPQTILAWALNGKLLDVGHGAPLRLRVERQLGYKHAKYVQRIEAVADFKGIYGGRGGYWEDSIDYEWYAGI